jgi:ABC-2 type transport system permease protein
MLPDFWQRASLVNPVLYMVNAFRAGMLGVSDVDVTTAITIIVAFVIGLFGFALWLMQRGVGIRN